MSRKIELNNIITQNKDIDAVDIDGEMAMMNIEKSKYYGFNGVGSRIWELIEAPIEVKDVINTLLNEYDVQASDCKDTVVKFLNELYSEQLILIE